MYGKCPILLSAAQQRIYVDAIFRMAGLEGFEITGTTGKESGDRPVVCARQISRYSVEISWSDEADHGPDATKAVWEVEVVESASDVGGGSKVHIVHVALYALDALRIAKGLVRFYHALTQRSRAANDTEVIAITLQTAE
jgi:hypothetical protein